MSGQFILLLPGLSIVVHGIKALSPLHEVVEEVRHVHHEVDKAPVIDRLVAGEGR